MNPSSNNQGSANVSFASTNWTMVFAAGEAGSPEGQEALASLCTAYFYPLFAFARRMGHKDVEAEDLTQGFLAELLSKTFLHKADRNQGRFRSFLLTAFKHYIANQKRGARAQKRGGDRRIVSINVAEAESRYACHPIHEQTAEQMFDNQWAVTLLDHVFALLRGEQVRANKVAIYEQLKRFLMSGNDEPTYKEIANRLEMSEGAVKMAVVRLRRRFGELLRQEIARTVTDASEVEDEIRGLFTALQSS